ncbi:unnamed protein product [Linum trigynum]|uniref:Uncharacterized protein n=1 Tax=Linum trigynum TaxID=586398 RepID=A0AAV2FJR5_9ROSI
MEKTAMKLSFFVALLFCIAGSEIRIADGIPYRCSVVPNCIQWCIDQGCQICTCLKHQCICRENIDNIITSNETHEITGSLSPTKQ